MQSWWSYCFALWVCGVAAASAQNATTAYPVKPIRFMVPFAPGGGNDIIARIVGQKLTEVWGQQVIVDNRPGAGGNIAAEITANAAPDGYTVFQFNVANTIAVSLYKKLAYDPVKDFAAVTQLASNPFMLVIHPSVRAKTVQELVALAKSQPGKLNYASSGNGGSSHLVSELFKTMSGTDIVHIPYAGSGPALNDLIAGQVQVEFTAPSAVIGHVKSGRVRALGVSSLKRIALAPDVPTVAESGVAGFDASAWYGVVVPARTPQPVINRLHGEVVKILAGPTRQRLEAQGFEPDGGTPAAFAAYIKSEIAKWANVIKTAGIPAE